MQVSPELIKEIKSHTFKQQLDFIRDKAKRKALFVGRRAGKTTAISILYLLYALTIPSTRLVYIGLSGGSAEDALMPALQPLIKDYYIPHKYNNTERFFTFDNGTVLSMKGFDTSYKEMDKILGGKCYSVTLDECQSQTQDLQKAIERKIAPAVSDYLPQHGGLIITAGTAGDYRGDHHWYQINSTPNHLGWSQHTWNHMDNPFMLEAKLIEEEVFRKQYGDNFRELPFYQQQYLCQWVVDEAGLCYHFDSLKNQAESLPIINSAKWEYFMGIDLGYEDDNALVVFAYNKFSHILYIVATHRFNHSNYHEIASEILKLLGKYPCQKLIVDTGGGGKVVAKTFAFDFGIPMVAADKSGDKKSRIARMDSYMAQGRIKVLPGNDALLNEWANLRWNKHKRDLGVWEEEERYKNHLGDAALYGFTATYPYLAEPPPIEIAHLPQHSEFFYQVQAKDRRESLNAKHAGNFSSLIKRDRNKRW